jgi:hypothetical protein
MQPMAQAMGKSRQAKEPQGAKDRLASKAVPMLTKSGKSKTERGHIRHAP